MTKIHIIGNSHTAALKEAMDNGNVAGQNVETTFFALQQDVFRHARLQSNGRFGIKGAIKKLGPKKRANILKVNGALDTDLSQSQVIVRVGIDWGITALTEIAARYAIPGISDNALPHRMTRPAFDAMCHALAKTTLPAPDLQELDKQIITVLRPIPSEACFERDNHKHPGLIQLCQDLNKIPDPAAAFDALITQIKALHIKHGCIAIAPPPETRGKACLTRLEYSLNSSNLAMASRANDVLHMNQDYACLVWDMILEQMDG